MVINLRRWKHAEIISPRPLSDHIRKCAVNGRRPVSVFDTLEDKSHHVADCARPITMVWSYFCVSASSVGLLVGTQRCIVDVAKMRHRRITAHWLAYIASLRPFSNEMLHAERSERVAGWDVESSRLSFSASSHAFHLQEGI